MDTYISNDPNSEGHVYHLPMEKGVEVLVDLSVGHNHAFVRTREQLRDIVINKTYLAEIESPVDGKYGLNVGVSLPWSDKTREGTFKRVWGDTSRQYPLPIARWPEHLRRSKDQLS